MLTVELRNMGGRIRAHSFKAGLFNMNEDYDFDLNISKGGIKKLKLDFVMDKQYINERQMPFFSIKTSEVEFVDRLWRVDVITKDLGARILDAIVKILRDPILDVFRPIIDGPAFPFAANEIIALFLSENKGEIKMGPL